MRTGHPPRRQAHRAGPVGWSRWRLRSLVAVVCVVLSAGVLAACSDQASPQGEVLSTAEVGADVVDAVTATLEERGAALAADDRDRFLASIRRADPEFREQQLVYYDNLAQLPIAEIGFALDVATLVPTGEHYWGEVVLTLQLAGYDAVPVNTRDRFRFSRSRDGQRYVVSSTTDTGWEASRGVQEQPWDVGPIRVVHEDGVLGIFDDATVAVAPNVLDSVSYTRLDVARLVPDAGLVDVVVYATSDVEFLQELRGLPVQDPQQLDAVTIPVLADPQRSGSPIAGYRVLVNPRILDERLDILDRLMRHELTHVALGDRAQGAPLWVSEGIAEWVSVQPIAPPGRLLPPGALAVARQGWDRLPADAAFSGSDAEVWYAVSWWICEYIANTYGPSHLWSMLDRFADGDEPVQVIGDLFGIRPDELVRGGMELMLARYEPAPTPTPTPAPEPTPTPSAEPSSTPSGEPSATRSDPAADGTEESGD